MNIFSTVWKRARWGRYGLIGLGMILTVVVMYIVAVGILVGVSGGQFLHMMSTMKIGLKSEPITLRKLMPAIMGGMFLAYVAAFFFFSFVHSGLTGSVVALRAGESVGFGGFFKNGARYFWRMAGLLFMSGLLMMLVFFGAEFVFLIAGVIAGVISAVTHVKAVLLVLVPLGLLVVPFMISVQIYLMYYTAYLMINDRLEVFAAIGKAFSALFKGLGEAYLTALVYLGILLVILVPTMALTVIMAMVGRGLGILTYLVIMIPFAVFGAPFLVDYLAERFEQRVRPKLGA